jgi:hypothetical protein
LAIQSSCLQQAPLKEVNIQWGWHVVATEWQAGPSKLHDLVPAAQGQLQVELVD